MKPAVQACLPAERDMDVDTCHGSLRFGVQLQSCPFFRQLTRAGPSSGGGPGATRALRAPQPVTGFFQMKIPYFCSLIYGERATFSGGFCRCLRAVSHGFIRRGAGYRRFFQQAPHHTEDREAGLRAARGPAPRETRQPRRLPGAQTGRRPASGTGAFRRRETRPLPQHGGPRHRAQKRDPAGRRGNALPSSSATGSLGASQFLGLVLPRCAGLHRLPPLS